LKNGSIDAMFYVAGFPVKLFSENVSGNDKLHLIPITNKSITEFYPMAQIPANTYVWQPELIHTIAVKAVLVSFLKTASARGRKVFVVVDEAQRIPARFLKEIISWSEFRLNRVLTVILAGQLEFHNILGTHLGQDWRNHIKTHAFLEPLDENETKLYINKRLELAGSKRNIFLVSAIHEVHVYSKGFPRLINIACDQALIAAFAKIDWLIHKRETQ